MGFLIGHVYIRQISPVYSSYFGLWLPPPLALFLLTHTNLPLPPPYWDRIPKLLVKSNACTVNPFAPRHVPAQYRNRIFWYYPHLYRQSTILLSTTLTPSLWPVCAPNVGAPNLHAPLTHGTWRAQLIASIYCLMGNISCRISQF